MNTIRGVNLGGWLVLEKWMTPELYEGYDAEDEYHLLKAMGEHKYSLIQKHRDTFITKEDFLWIKKQGIDTVRLPVGYWLFDAESPYISAKDYVDLAFKWAKETDLNIMLDVHAAPGCQNGFDNGGLSGVCEWHKNDVNIQKTIDFIQKLCLTYRAQNNFAGIQVLNEPRWDIPLETLFTFYKSSYDIIRASCKDNVYVVFHDGFRLNAWETFFKENQFENVFLDTHMYQVFSHKDALRQPAEVVEKVAIKRLEELQAVMPYVNVIVGEWSLGIHENTLKAVQSDVELHALYRAIGNSLLMTFEKTSGWFFWSYKLSEKATKKNIGWSFRDVVNKVYIKLI